MNRPTLIAAALGFAALVFSVVFWLTFPSEAVGSRIAYEVDKATAGRMRVEMDAASPWWFGLTAKRVIVSTVDTPGAAPVPAFLSEKLGANVGLLSLVRRAPAVDGFVRLGSSEEGDARDVTFAVRTALKDGELHLRSLLVDGAGVPVAELIALAPNISGVEFIGGVDVDVDMKMGQGLEKADGSVSLLSRDLVLASVSHPMLGADPKEIDLRVDELDLRLSFEAGLGTVVRGVLASSLADVELEGTLTLADEIGRSRLDLDVVIELADWTGTALESYRSLVDSYASSARWQDGTLHFKISQQLGRLSAMDLRPERDRNARPTTSTYTPPTRPTFAPEEGASGGWPTGAGNEPAVAPDVGVAPMRPEPAPSIDEIPLDEEELPVDEEELPLDDEEGPIDEEPPNDEFEGDY